MFIKKEVFKRIGYLDERFFLYYEDVDFCLRAKEVGFECCFVQESMVYHIGSTSTIVGSPLHTYYNARNRLLFLEKYSSTAAKIIEIIMLIKTTLRFLIKRQRQDKFVLLGLKDYLLRNFGQNYNI